MTLCLNQNWLLLLTYLQYFIGTFGGAIPPKPLYSFGTVKRRLPDALIIGAKKSGTRALLEFLKLHPDIQATGPEIHFFDRKYHLGLNWYRQKMPLAFDDQLVMEKTPAYLVDPEVPARVHDMNPQIKLILVLRNPITRALSDYSQSLERKGPSVGSFSDRALLPISPGHRMGHRINASWPAISRGVYIQHLANWLEYFPLRQMLLVSGEELIESPAQVLEQVQSFLGLDPLVTGRHFYMDPVKGFFCVKKPWGAMSGRCFGRNKGRTHPRIRPKLLKKLTEFYRPHNEALYNLTGINFGWENS